MHGVPPDEFYLQVFDIHRSRPNSQQTQPGCGSTTLYTAGMAETAILERTAVVRHGRRLEYFTIARNALEGLVAVVAVAIAGSIALVGFGIASFIEVTSGSVFLWRMSVDAVVLRRERNERRALRVVGFSFLFLAAYIAYES